MTKWNGRKIFLWLLILIWMGVIFYLSSQVADTSNALSHGVSERIVETVHTVVPKASLTADDINHMVRKYAHFFAYLVLGFLMGLAFKKWPHVIGFGILYAISDEWHQRFVPGRGPGILDVAIDAAGVCAGLCLLIVLKYLLKIVKEDRTLGGNMKFNSRHFLLLLIDIVIVNASMFFAFLLRFDFNLTSIEGYSYFYLYLTNVVEITVIKLLILYLFGIYNSLWHYTSIDELAKIILSLTVGTLAVYGYLDFFGTTLPRSIYLLSLMMDIVMVSGVRISYRFLRRYRIRLHNVKRKRVLIYGAGQAGAMLIKELKEHPESDMKAIAVVDDDPSKAGRSLSGIHVYKSKSLLTLLEEHAIDVIIIAMPSAPKSKINEIIERTKDFKGERKILPGVYEFVNSGVTLQNIRNIRIEDLLGRDVVKLDTTQIDAFINEKVVIVTGGAGSIGSELVRQISKYRPSAIHLIDVNENEMHFLSLELSKKYPENRYYYHIGNIRERTSMMALFEQIRPQVVFHAAAHKHVPLMEHNPREAIKNNVLGTRNLIEAAKHVGVKKFVQISTDKAVNPTNVMGATKRICEMMVQASCHQCQTEFAAVRFGNVLGSNGSVIPIFKNQIEKGGPVTLTHPDITRYFMTIPEAASLVLQAGAMAVGGEIFVLDMGEPVKIMDLAENLIRLSGFEPYKDIDIKITGLRPGEKMYEELLINPQAINQTAHDKIFVEAPTVFEDSFIDQMIADFETAAATLDNDHLKSLIKEVVPTYQLGH
ncbi:VanZ family protein [Fusibacter paucivorans]|uniref:VanZ family protein n=1 Tax=Fusibacter paucivorans TaxID=76009 RepID=A0ABS5PLW6_9FIRM|nr:VanZ family protein [Fusibacter paucivorans]MBS7525877.1 VanZ family protein [Fusibacter paucivorans]